uniref:Neuromedin S n=1 Tax=Gallus gallus TaxID=9031 RepID=A0A8V0YVW4_CHICK
MPLPPPALPWLLAACCLCALPRGSGFPQPLSRYRDGAELPKSQQLALCFSQWMELSNQPQISSTVLDLCYSIFNSLQTNEVRCNCCFYLKDSHGTLGRPFFLFRVFKSLPDSVNDTEMMFFFFLAGVNCSWNTKASKSFPVINADSPLLPVTFSHLIPCENPLIQISACRSESSLSHI